MIGDSDVDVSTARNLNMPVGIVSWGYTKTPVGQMGADFVIECPTDLPGLLRSVARKNEIAAGIPLTNSQP